MAFRRGKEIIKVKGAFSMETLPSFDFKIPLCYDKGEMGELLLRFDEVSFIYPGMKDNLFEGVSFSIFSGERIGLLGYNGSGKTTLLDLIYGTHEPDYGRIQRKKEEIFYLRQEDYAEGMMTVLDFLLSTRPKLSRMYGEILQMEEGSIRDSIEYSELIQSFRESGGYRFLHLVEKVRSLFGFPEELMKRRVDSLSGGEKRLLKLASGFIDERDLYLLDEPTNYLDDLGIQFLIKAILASSGAFLIVSHDRWFLDQTVSKIFEIDRGRMREWKGNYSVFIHTKETEFKERLRKKEKIQKEIEKLKEVERTYKIWGKRKEKQKKGAGDKGFISHRAAKLMKRAIHAKERLQRKIDELEKAKPWIEKSYSVRFEKVDFPKGACLSANGLGKRMGEKVLFWSLSLTLAWGEKVSLVGPNGSGKTTLLRILLGIEPPDEGEVIWSKLVRIGYLPQEWLPEEDNLHVHELFQEKEEEKALILLGCLNVKGDCFRKDLGSLSEGQKRKIKLAQLLVREPNLLILDEPTTHLDYQTVEILERALSDFHGSIILVTHDRYLRERVTEREIRLENKGSRKH